MLKADPAQKAGASQVLTTEFQLESPQDIDRLFLGYQMARALKVSLNGTRIMDLPKLDRPDSRPVNLMLKPITRELLVKGTNTLTVEFTPGGTGGQVALKRGQ